MLAGRRAGHVVAALVALDGDAAFGAGLPAVFLGGLDEVFDLFVLRAGFEFRVVPAVALGADFFAAARALAVELVALLVGFDLFGLDPCAALLARAVEPIFSAPFLEFFVPGDAEGSGEKMVACAGLDGFGSAAFGGHLVDVFDAEFEGASDAVGAPVVLAVFEVDAPLSGKILEAGVALHPSVAIESALG